MARKRSVLESQGCVLAVLGLSLALAGPIFERSKFALGFSALFGFVLAIAGGALFLSAPNRMPIAKSMPEPGIGSENWPTSTERLVTVCIPMSESELLFVEALLREHEVPFITQNANSQLAFDPPEVQVAAEDESRAREVLRATAAEPPANGPSSDDAS